jgi:hypothetical protein
VKSAVVYESMFGNTRAIAEAIAVGLASSGAATEVVVMSVNEVTPEDLLDIELLVVGGPTHLRQMTTLRTRGMRAGSMAKFSGGGTGGPEQLAQTVTTGVREWLLTVSTVGTTRHAAAFDTRLAYLPIGGAAPLIARCLRRRRYHVDAPPRSFFVESAHGPLRRGERERAEAWGAALVNRM